jgi:hypothetical protein
MVVGIFMVNFLSSLPANWEEFLERIADEHDIDVGKVIGELCNWAFSRSEYKAQFEAWLDKAYPPKGQAEDMSKDRGEAASEREQAREDIEEEEAHEDREYSEDQEV